MRDDIGGGQVANNAASVHLSGGGNAFIGGGQVSNKAASVHLELLVPHHGAANAYEPQVV
jgi:hypothetical protein